MTPTCQMLASSVDALAALQLKHPGGFEPGLDGVHYNDLHAVNFKSDILNKESLSF